MSQQTHIKTNTHKIFLVIIFCLVLGFGFGRGEKAEAISNPFSCSGVDSSAMGECFCIGEPGEMINKSIACNECNNALADIKYKEKKCFWKNTNETFLGIPTEIKTKTADIEPDDVCGGTWDTLKAGPGAWLNCFLLYILRFLVFLLSLSATLFGWIIKPENIKSVISNAVVYEAWTMVRDALNVSFIMFLLFSAFATVFQVDKYSYKKTLLTIVIMALLVNFSFPISRFIIDVSNMMMYYFISALTINGNPASASWFVDMTQNANIQDMLAAKVSADTSYLLAAVVFVFILAVTFLTIAVLFVIRTIALAILIIFSSLAFIGTAIPPLSSYANDWWKKLFSYCFFGPIMIFMLYIASAMMGTISKLGDGDMEKIAGLNSATPGIIAAYSFFAIPIVILWMGLGIAQSMSIAGAGAVVGKAQGFMKGTGKWLGHKADRGLASTGRSKNKFIRPLQFLSPTALKTAWKQREEELDKKAFGPATGNWRDTLNRFWTVNPKKWMNRQSRHGEAAIQSLVAQHEKDAEAVSTDFAYIYGEYKMAEKAKDKEKMAAMLRIIAKTNEFNSFSKAEGFVMDPFELKRELFKRLKKVGMQESEAGKHIADMGEIAYGKGNYQLYGMSAIDAKGNYAETSDDKQIELSRGKAKNIKAQTKTDLWHWNSFLQQDTDGNAGKLHRFGEIQLEQLNTAVLDQLNRVRDDFFDGLITQVGAIDTYAELVKTGRAGTATLPEIKANPEQAKIIRGFSDKIRERKGQSPKHDQKDKPSKPA